jgi:hypothetical protein
MRHHNHHPSCAWLQGATFTGLSQHQRKFSNVANEHHFLCLLGGDLTALATQCHPSGAVQPKFQKIPQPAAVY